MSRNQKIATIFGGTGFIGRQIVWELAKQGYTIKVATRVPERAYFLKPAGMVGQIVPFSCDYKDPESIRNAVDGAEVVVNCIGILYEKGKGRRFEKAHFEIPKAIAESCARKNVKRFVHISALGVDKGGSQYAHSKMKGEQAVLDAFPKATIFRPSVVFGENDSFFNMFARMATILPVLPLIGGGKTRFQPVYVGDVADAVLAALVRPALGENNPQGQIYELGGPEIVTFKEIYERLFRFTGRSRPLISVPFFMAKIQGRFLSLLPQPPLTADQVESLKTDSVVSGSTLTLVDLGVRPTAMNLILPEYLMRYRSGGRFGKKAVI